MEWKWMILLAVSTVSFFQFGSMKVLGIFIPRLVEHLDVSKTEAGLSCGIGIAIARLLGPLWGAIVAMTSNRFVTILGGILTGIGIILVSFSRNVFHLYCSMVVMSVGLGLPMVGRVLVLTEYFREDFNMANGVGFAGGAVGMISLAPLVDFLITTYGWKGGLVIFGALCLNICVAGIVMKPNKNKEYRNLRSSSDTSQAETQIECLHPQRTISEQTSKDADVSSFLSKLLDKMGYTTVREPALCIYFAVFMLQEVALSGWMLFLFTYSTSLGFNTLVASFLSAVAGLGTLTGRIICGPLLDKNVVSARVLISSMSLGGCSVLVAHPFTTSYQGLVIVSFLTGFFIASFNPVYITLLRDMFPNNSREFSCAVGLHYTVRGIGLLCGGPLTGWIYDSTDNFHLAFYTLAGFEALGAFLIIVKPCISSHIRGAL